MVIPADVGGVLRELKGRVIDAQTCGRTILTMLEHWLPNTSSLCILPKNYGKICTVSQLLNNCVKSVTFTRT